MQTDVTLTKRSVDLCIRLGLKGKVIHAYFEQKEREREREKATRLIHCQGCAFIWDHQG